MNIQKSSSPYIILLLTIIIGIPLLDAYLTQKNATNNTHIEYIQKNTRHKDVNRT